MTPGTPTTDALVLDTETTGVDPATDRVVELAAVVLRNGALAERFHTRVNPGVPIPAEATAVHGIRDEDVRDAPAFADLAGRIATRLAAFDMHGGYNAGHFDAPLLNAEMERAGHAYRIDLARVLDPMPFVRWHLRHLRSRKLVDVCALYGIDVGAAHTALADAEAAARLIVRLVNEGIIPQVLSEALATQACYAAATDAEFARWGYWLYADRETEALRIGCGKHCGTLLADVPADYLRYCAKLDDVPEETRAAFLGEAGRGAA